jgi:CMP-N,N'-diacetyllegionaminic acid synthase
MNKKILWAIIPARSGSVGLKNKNITSFLGKPLLAHSINFAKKLKFVDKILLSTDSQKYKKIGYKIWSRSTFFKIEKSISV